VTCLDTLPDEGRRTPRVDRPWRGDEVPGSGRRIHRSRARRREPSLGPHCGSSRVRQRPVPTVDRRRFRRELRSEYSPAGRGRSRGGRPRRATGSDRASRTRSRDVRAGGRPEIQPWSVGTLDLVETASDREWGVSERVRRTPVLRLSEGARRPFREGYPRPPRSLREMPGEVHDSIPDRLPPRAPPPASM